MSDTGQQKTAPPVGTCRAGGKGKLHYRAMSQSSTRRDQYGRRREGADLVVWSLTRSTQATVAPSGTALEQHNRSVTRSHTQGGDPWWLVTEPLVLPPDQLTRALPELPLPHQQREDNHKFEDRIPTTGEQIHDQGGRIRLGGCGVRPWRWLGLGLPW